MAKAKAFVMEIFITYSEPIGCKCSIYEICPYTHFVIKWMALLVTLQVYKRSENSFSGSFFKVAKMHEN